MARMDFGGIEHAGIGADATAEIFFQLGLTYSTGREGVTDLVTAHKWFNLAALKGKSEAAEYRQELSSEMSKDDVACALREAREWLRLH
ncbi:sel1 repeat family protein [Coralliovum pocilloporae]|uniref:sel1 repeat family protein n=1 Tax=Coralliovum pocilloporae TaxID=3066369 RepID=UPI0033078B28